jgi:hypothetical protein
MFTAITGALAGDQPSSLVKSQFSYLLSLEATRGRKALLEAVRRAIELQGELQPTYAHRAAVRLFPRVVTTNFDELFEAAAREQQIDLPAVSGDLRTAKLAERTVIKLHGTVAQPDTMILTDRDVAVIDKVRPRLWRALVRELTQAPLVVVGHSLRDPSLLRLFSEAAASLSGYLVAPRIADEERTVYSRWGLRALDSEAEPFFAALEAMVAA